MAEPLETEFPRRDRDARIHSTRYTGKCHLGRQPAGVEDRRASGREGASGTAQGGPAWTGDME